jgi:phosphosulfolactate synthase
MTAWPDRSTELARGNEGFPELLNLPDRTGKPRQDGLTLVNDTGIPIAELRGILADYHELIDVAKLGIGTACLTPNLKAKLLLYRSYDVIPYFGGTLFEKCMQQGQMESYLDFLAVHDIDWIEVSTGSVDVPLEIRTRLTERYVRNFTVVAEVGYKETRRELSYDQWIMEIQALLKAGAKYVILEGRDSGTSGIYDSESRIRTELVETIAQSIDPRRLIFEAPVSHGRAFCINLVGCNVNLGNVSPRDLLVLECERRGLRFDTLSVRR